MRSFPVVEPDPVTDHFAGRSREFTLAEECHCATGDYSSSRGVQAVMDNVVINHERDTQIKSLPRA